MAQPISTHPDVSAPVQPKGVSALAVAGAGFGAAFLIGALALWFHYGTAVFFETIASGLAACL